MPIATPSASAETVTWIEDRLAGVAAISTCSS